MFRSDQAETQASSSAAATAEVPAPPAPLGDLKARISAVYICTLDAIDSNNMALALAEDIRHTSCAAHLRPKLRAARSILEAAAETQRQFLKALGASVREPRRHD